MPFETYLINTGGSYNSMRWFRSEKEVQSEVIERHQAIARQGGKFVTQHSVELGNAETQSTRPTTYIMIVAEFPDLTDQSFDTANEAERGHRAIEHGADIIAESIRAVQDTSTDESDKDFEGEGRTLWDSKFPGSEPIVE